MSVVDKLLVNLRVIATVNEGDKLVYTSTGNFIPQSPGILISLYRFVTRDDRWHTLSRLNDLISTSETMQEFNNGSEKHRIQRALENSVKGLRHLQLTYQTDVLFYQSLQVLIERVEDICQKRNVYLLCDSH